MDIREVLKIENLGRKYTNNLTDNVFIVKENIDDKLQLLDVNLEFSITDIFELGEILNAKYIEVE